MDANTTEQTAASTTITKEVFSAPKEMSFYFKTKKGEENELGEKQPDYKRPTVKLEVPVPTFDGLVASLNKDESGKVAAFLLSLIEQEVYLEARNQVNDKDPFEQKDLDLNALTLEALANRPASERKGSAISDELWKLFETDYVTVMASVTSDKTEKQIKTAAELMVNKFSKIREKKNIIATLRSYLQQWYTATTLSEELSAVYDYLDGRAVQLINAEVTPKTFDI